MRLKDSSSKTWKKIVRSIINLLKPLINVTPISADYPFINYYVIEKPRSEAESFYRSARGHAYDTFNPTRLGYKCDQSIDLFEEVATIARPPVDAIKSKKPVTEATGYILCVYKVFKGDDGEKFERNWLYWSGKNYDFQLIKVNK